MAFKKGTQHYFLSPTAARLVKSLAVEQEVSPSKWVEQAILERAVKAHSSGSLLRVNKDLAAAHELLAAGGA